MPTEPDRRPSITPNQFHREYAVPNKPLILTEVDFWRGSEPCSPALFRQLYGTYRVGDLAFGIGGAKVLSPAERRMRFGDYMELFQAGSAEASPAPLPYLRNLDLRSNFPEIEQWFHPTDRFGRNLLLSPLNPGRQLAHGEIFLGPAHSTYGVLHFDRLFMFVVTYQLFGRKEWWLYSPTESRFCYPMNMDGHWYRHHSEIHPEDPDLERFPLFARARGQRVILEEGEILFCPASWWHTTRNLTPHHLHRRSPMHARQF